VLRSELPYTKAAATLGLALAVLILPAALLHPEPFAKREYSLAVDESWFGRASAQLDLRSLQVDGAPPLRDLAALTRAFVVVDDGEWYEHEITSIAREDQHLRVLLDLEHGWKPRAGGAAWGPRFLRHVRKVEPLPPAYVSGDLALFPEARGVQIELRDLADGVYRVEVWDTWQAGAFQPLELAVSAGVGRVTLPPLRRDVALELVLLAP
jgi:hypothetical protein